MGLVKFSSQKLQSIHEETCKDDELQLLKEIILEGWPETPRQIPSTMKSYWPFRDELFIDNGIILKDDRVIIPTSMQTEIQNKIHDAHQNIDKMVKTCHLCQEFKKCQPAAEKSALRLWYCRTLNFCTEVCLALDTSKVPSTS